MKVYGLTKFRWLTKWEANTELIKNSVKTTTSLHTSYKSRQKHDHFFTEKSTFFSVKITFLLNKEVTKELISRKFLRTRNSLWQIFFVRSTLYHCFHEIFGQNSLWKLRTMLLSRNFCQKCVRLNYCESWMTFSWKD